ncbi:MAG: hypothetical protein AABY22_07885 [Nanoarchaeota archaeon]
MSKDKKYRSLLKLDRAICKHCRRPKHILKSRKAEPYERYLAEQVALKIREKFKKGRLR